MVGLYIIVYCSYQLYKRGRIKEIDLKIYNLFYIHKDINTCREKRDYFKNILLNEFLIHNYDIIYVCNSPYSSYRLYTIHLWLKDVRLKQD